MKVIYESSDFEKLPIHSEPETMSGAIVFKGTRVPINALWNNLASGASIDDFLEWFPTVAREQAEAVLKEAYRELAAATEQVVPL